MFLRAGEEREESLWGERDAPGVSNLTLLQVLHQLGQPALGGGVVLQDLGEGGVFELVREALPQSFSSSVQEVKNTGQAWIHCWTHVFTLSSLGVGNMTTLSDVIHLSTVRDLATLFIPQ